MRILSAFGRRALGSSPTAPRVSSISPEACPRAREISYRVQRIAENAQQCRRHFRYLALGQSDREAISTDHAPAAAGPYSQAIKAGRTIYLSGQLGVIPGTKDFAANDVTGQTEQALKNLGAVLKASGSDYDRVVKTTVLLADMADFAEVNQVYGQYFPEAPPARACYAVKTLPLGGKVEIEAVALA